MLIVVGVHHDVRVLLTRVLALQASELRLGKLGVDDPIAALLALITVAESTKATPNEAMASKHGCKLARSGPALVV